MASAHPIRRESSFMTNRDWLCLALRLLGIWILIQAIEGIIPYLFYLFAAFGSVGGFQTIAFTIVWLILRTALAMVLVSLKIECPSETVPARWSPLVMR